MTEIIIGDEPEEITGRGVVYIPIIRTVPNPGKEFFQFMLADGRQQRKVLIWDDRLALAAHRRAAAQFGDGLSHYDINGVGPNAYAREAGFVLPSYYGDGNNIESLTAGTPDTLAAFESLARSPSHSKHIFGLVDFFREQDRIGIAMITNPVLKYKYYWAILIAKGA